MCYDTPNKSLGAKVRSNYLLFETIQNCKSVSKRNTKGLLIHGRSFDFYPEGDFLTEIIDYGLKS